MIKIIQIMLLSFLFYLPCFAQPASDPNADTVRKTIQTFMEENEIPGVAVELYVDGKPYSYYFGFANPDKKVLVTKKTIFEVGSISKILTSLLLAEEIDFAKMHLDDAITKYLTNLPDEMEDISLKNLATHTSGLPFNVPATIKSQTEFKKYIDQFTLPYATDDQWVYSNVGIGLLGFAVEKVTHKNINQLYRQQILSPLKMQAVGTVVPETLKSYYAKGHDKNGKLVPASTVGLFPAAGSLKASSADMQKFLSAAIGLAGTPEKILYPMRMTQTAYVKLPDNLQGLAWQIHRLTTENIAILLDEADTADLGPIEVEQIYDQPTFNGDALIDKTGATAGFRTYIALIPNKKSGIVILANKSVANGEIVRTGREILFELAKVKVE